MLVAFGVLPVRADFETWCLGHFPDQLSRGLSTLAAENPDRDTTTNLTEFICGTDPNAADGQSIPITASWNNGQLTIVTPRSKAAATLITNLEISSDLINWSLAEASIKVGKLSETMDQLSVTLPILQPQPRQLFARVIHSLPSKIGKGKSAGDIDDDGIPDATENVILELQNNDWTDAMEDVDADGVPNLWEFKLNPPGLLNPTHGINDAAIKPPATRFVNPATGNNSPTDTIHTSIQAAINAVPAGTPANPTFAIIEVAPAAYVENITIPANRSIFLKGISSAQGERPGIWKSATSGDQLIQIYSQSMLSGFRIAKGASTSGDSRALWFRMNSETKTSRLQNCIIHGHIYSTVGGAAVRVGDGSGGRLVINHCTLFHNYAPSNGHSIYLSANSALHLSNSIVRGTQPGNTGGSSEDIDGPGSKLVVASYVLRNPPSGSLTGVLPNLNPYGLLTTSSQVNNHANSNWLSQPDFQGELRAPISPAVNAAVGADQFSDTDADTIPNFFDPVGAAASADSDGDGWTNNNEYNTRGTNPLTFDTDLDGIPDRQEEIWGLNSINAFDGLGDQDGDGLTGIYEYNFIPRLKPADADTDDDGLLDGAELNVYLTDPHAPDTDGDGLPDGVEVANGSNPINATNGSTDADGDGLSLTQELLLGSNPLVADTNGDGISDGYVAQRGFSPLSADPDGDTLLLSQESAMGTSPLLADSDGDGMNDNLDAFPLDPARTAAPPAQPGDTTPPVITITFPN